MFGIIPRDRAFYELFDRAATTMVDTAHAFRESLRGDGICDTQVGRIRELEHQGDRVVRETLDRLDRTFLTPFDREDIQAMMTRVEDVIDDIDAAAKRLKLYRITAPTPWLRKQSDVLLDACRALGEAIAGLRELRKPERIREPLRRVWLLENTGDDHRHGAVAELYATTTDPIHAMKWKELYDLIEAAINRCEDIANGIEAIILKNT